MVGGFGRAIIAGGMASIVAFSMAGIVIDHPLFLVMLYYY